MDDQQNAFSPKQFSSMAGDAVILKPLPLAAAVPAATEVAEKSGDQAQTSAKALLDDLAAVLDAACKPAMPAAPESAAEPARAVAANKAKIIIKALRTMEQNIANIIRLLEEDAPSPAVMTYDADITGALMERETELASVRPVDGRVVEGVFDGQNMVGSDGKIYTVPPNYASKSKLVEGDLLKLTITARGSFIYKQIGPIERGRVVGSLGFDATVGEFYVTGDDKRWSVIKASVTYFKGEAGDEAVILVPKSAPSKWAAVENIIKKNPLA